MEAALTDCQCLDLSSLPQNGFVAPKVDVGERDVVQALVVALVIAILDDDPDLAFEIAWEVMVFQQQTVFHRLVPTFDFSLSLGPYGDASIACRLKDGMARHKHASFSDLPTILPSRLRYNMSHY